MIKCPNCKTENLDSAKFCKSCGWNLSAKQQNTNAIDSEEVEKKPSFLIALMWSILLIGVMVYFSQNSSESATSTPAAEKTSVVMQNYTRPLTAPNGQPWPISAGYIDGYDKLNTQGKSSITVDNTQNDSDVFVKLFALDTQQPYAVRHFFIPAYSSFTINKVNIGNYDVRYQDLGTGALSRTEQFQIEETDTGYSVEFTNLTLTIYKVQNGNMETYGLNASEF
jgi:hypothetical protein